jgi:HEAT repeat protein
MGDPTGTAALREVLNSGKSSEEASKRAVVALGKAGDASVRDKLIAIVDTYVGAADALAALKDPAAVAPLERQLTLNSMRVTAAFALRRMGRKVDLGTLADAIASGDEVARVSAAEAILILTGPDRIAERD